MELPLNFCIPVSIKIYQLMGRYNGKTQHPDFIQTNQNFVEPHRTVKGYPYLQYYGQLWWHKLIGQLTRLSYVSLVYNLQYRILSVLTDLSNSGLTFHTPVDTCVQLADLSYVVNITTGPSLFDLNLITSSTNSFPQPLVNKELVAPNPIPELETTSDLIEQYRLATQVKTVVDL